jgi:predicted nucleic acid-binding protein
MKRIVVDASVVVKWLLPVREEEQDVEEALQVLRLIRDLRLSVHQPPHWLAEAAAVVTRLSPDNAPQDIQDLCEMGFEVIGTHEVYTRACELSSRLDHHLFDTLYHAVGLTIADATLITADERYYRKARKVGRISLLKNIGRELKPF